MLIAHRLLGLVFFSAKLISKLPVVHTADKLLGAIVGVVETALIIWLIFALTDKMGMVGTIILENTQGNRILNFLYAHNYLQYFLTQIQKVLA